MLLKNPQGRPSPTDVLSHKLFEGFDLKETATETADTGSLTKMNKVYKTLYPKSIANISAHGFNFD